MESSRRTAIAFTLALLVHGLLFGVLVISLGWTSKPESKNTDSVQIVQATVVNKNKILAEMDQQQRAERELQQTVTPEPEKVEQHAVETQRQQQKIAEQAQREAKKRQELEQRRQQEQARLKQLEAEREAKEAARRKIEAEKKRVEEEKRRAEVERRRLEEEKRKAEVAKRKAEEERKKAEAARRKAEEERRQRELQASIEAEQNAAQTEAAIERFIPQLQMRVQRYWIRPPSTHDNMVVLLQVELLPSGDVRDVKIVESSGDRTFDRSAQAAVYRAAPLPVPTDPAAAAKLRSFNFKFCPGSSC
jgi:colicin import membrane protein